MNEITAKYLASIVVVKTMATNSIASRAALPPATLGVAAAAVFGRDPGGV